MTDENKKLLIRSLCELFPYDIKCDYKGELVYMIDSINLDTEELVGMWNGMMDVFELEECRPYLRSLSSMTKEEVEKFTKLIFIPDSTSHGYLKECILFAHCSGEAVEWLKVNHFDYFGLIEKSLAIEITKENNPYKNE